MLKMPATGEFAGDIGHIPESEKKAFRPHRHWGTLGINIAKGNEQVDRQNQKKPRRKRARIGGRKRKGGAYFSERGAKKGITAPRYDTRVSVGHIHLCVRRKKM